MKTIALLHGKNWVLIDHEERKMHYLPERYYEADDHYMLAQRDISSYLYEHTNYYERITLFNFEE